MIRPTFVFGLVAMTAVVAAPAEDFPLTFRSIPAKDVMSFPCGSGTCGQLELAKPAKPRKEPKVVSRHPLYRVCGDAPTGPAILFRLDESKGDSEKVAVNVDFNFKPLPTASKPVDVQL